jgi:hypothetical protein
MAARDIGKPPGTEYAVNKAMEEKDYPTANKLMDIQVSGAPGGYKAIKERDAAKRGRRKMYFKRSR